VNTTIFNRVRIDGRKSFIFIIFPVGALQIFCLFCVFFFVILVVLKLQRGGERWVLGVSATIDGTCDIFTLRLQ
jgi:hypothetical protein